MINTQDILETINMIREENLDIRTITMGISLLKEYLDMSKKTFSFVETKIKNLWKNTRYLKC